MIRKSNVFDIFAAIALIAYGGIYIVNDFVGTVHVTDIHLVIVIGTLLMGIASIIRATLVAFIGALANAVVLSIRIFGGLPEYRGFWLKLNRPVFLQDFTVIVWGVASILTMVFILLYMVKAYKVVRFFWIFPVIAQASMLIADEIVNGEANLYFSIVLCVGLLFMGLAYMKSANKMIKERKEVKVTETVQRPAEEVKTTTAAEQYVEKPTEETVEYSAASPEEVSEEAFTKCPNCGNVLPAKAKFCAVCGTKI